MEVYRTGENLSYSKRKPQNRLTFKVEIYFKRTMENLHEFANNIWLADGPIVRDMGAFFTTRMTVVKLSDGAIWISSPVPVSFRVTPRIP